jgi:hypothetical protein
MKYGLEVHVIVCSPEEYQVVASTGEVMTKTASTLEPYEGAYVHHDGRGNRSKLNTNSGFIFMMASENVLSS